MKRSRLRGFAAVMASTGLACNLITGTDRLDESRGASDSAVAVDGSSDVLVDRDAPPPSDRDGQVEGGGNHDAGDAETAHVDAADAEAASPILFVQTDAREVTNTSNPVAFASAATAGDAIIVAIDFPTSSGATVTSVEDTLTNTYQSALGPYDGSGSRQYVYYAINRETGSNTVTVNLSATARCEVYIHEYSGLAATGTLDVGAVDSASGASDEDGGLVVGPITTNAPNELVFAFATCSDSCLPGSGFRQRSNFDGNFTADTIGKTSGSYELVGTATKGPWVASLLAFRGL